MLSVRARAQIGVVVAPLGRWLARTPITPDMITVVGTLGLVASALAFFPRGVFFLGTMIIVIFVFSDLIDGTLARARGTSSPWGAVLDSTCDRIGDAAIFGSLAYFYAGRGQSLLLLSVALYDLVAGSVTSYVRARAESLGLSCNVGVAERAERLIIVLLGAGFTGLGVAFALPAALWILAVLTTVTIGQRLVTVRRQAFAAPATSTGTAGAPIARPATNTLQLAEATEVTTPVPAAPTEAAAGRR